VIAIRVDRTGDAGVLQPVEIPPPEPTKGSLVVEVEAAGLNFIDTYQRSGLYPVPLPSVLGLEGAGRVVAVGEEVHRFAPGDRVAWADVPGSYAQLVSVPAARAVPVPQGVGLDEAAAVMLQGMTAHYLSSDTFPLQAGHRCLVHSGAGGVGLLLIQMAKMRGAEVFTTVGSEDKRDLPRSVGADHVLRYHDGLRGDFADEIEGIAGPHCLDVVYDGVGRATFERGLALLRPRGHMVTFGNASGPVDPVAPLTLSQAGSLYLTRPTLAHYIATREELIRRAGDVLTWVREGRLDVLIGARVPLTEAAAAHRMLEGRKTSGKVLLIP
jgi:NADPH2:quinone reductase